MIAATPLDKAIYQKYIEPTERKRRSHVGVEFELPIVNLKKEPVDFAVIHQLTDAFLKQFPFDQISRDDEGHINAAASSKTGDSLSYDCSYNTLELSFGVEDDLSVLHRRFTEYYTFLQEQLQRSHHMLTGMGINPYHEYNRKEPIPNGRYRMLFHHLQSYQNYGDVIPFHTHPDFGLFSCASQVQLDVERDDIPETLNTFNRLEPLKTLLFANSLWGEQHTLLCSRDQFWKNSLHGLNRRNVDLYEVEFQSVAEVVDYLKSMSLYCVERGDKYLNFRPTPLETYFAFRQITGEYFDGQGYQTLAFTPELEDLAYLRSFKLVDLTFRGTIEYRSICAQPVAEIMAPAAFHAGLAEKLPELTQLLAEDTALYGSGYSPIALRERLNQRGWPSFLEKEKISKLLLQVLSLAEDGLRKRGKGEERFLQSLYRRAEQLKSPALEMAEGLESGKTVEDYIIAYAKP
ncbi:MAG: glutamate-cysteine ligase family protein [Oscillospiraceae bacterium]|nr:glutamate-cysteine ligase family protein [Oscillospiraceae bacterium]